MMRKRSEKSLKYTFVTVSMVALILAAEPVAARENSGLPVNFSADTLSHDDQTQTVTAIGNVELIQGQRILRADKMVYNLATDTVSALGNVSLLDDTGDVHFAEYVELSDNMKDGFVHGLYSTLADGGRFRAIQGKREGGSRIVMTEASYTPCEPCENNPDDVVWQIKASEVIHDEDDNTVRYKNARLELLGVPVAYTPFFSHPDPNVERKSGFLRPGIGWSSELGPSAEVGYYWDIAPDKDATVWVKPTTLKGVLVQGEWRQRFENGRLQINGGIVESDRTEYDGRIEKNRKRGHLIADGQMDLNENWRTGMNIALTTDKEYVRLYDIDVPDPNVLKNRLYAERFSGRDYTLVQAMSFRDIRLGNRPDQPEILPLAEHRMIGEPGGTLGGRWSLGLGAAGLYREGDDQSVMRVSADAGWQRRFLSRTGLATTVDADVRADLYNVRNRTAALTDPTLDDDDHVARVHPTLNVVGSYPMARRLARGQAVIEPMVGFAASPRLKDQEEDVPNEDSLDVQLDTSNLFDSNRYPGVDRLEDGVRASYGMKAGLYGDDGRFVKAFAGQSYRFNDDDMFPKGSGLENKQSDYVARVSASAGRALTVDYAVKLNSEDLKPTIQEARVSTARGGFRASSRYLYAASVDGTGFTQSREQVSLNTSYDFTPNWTLAVTSLTDLGEEPGLRRGSIGLHYGDECFTFSAIGVRNIASSASGEDETSIMLRIGLKNIGEFTMPEIALDNKGSN